MAKKQYAVATARTHVHGEDLGTQEISVELDNSTDNIDDEAVLNALHKEALRRTSNILDTCIEISEIRYVQDEN